MIQAITSLIGICLSILVDTARKLFGLALLTALVLAVLFASFVLILVQMLN